MNPNKKVFITFLSFVLVMLVIACSCPVIPPTETPVQPDPMPGLAGTWNNPETSDVYEIALQNGQYTVVSCTWGEDTYEITSQSWTGSALTWSYYDTYYSLTVTVTTTSISGDNLNVNLSYSDGDSGTATLQRGDVVVVPDVTPDVLTGSDSLSVTSAAPGVVTNGSGVSITIPAGAVPANDDGSIGSMTFSISENPTVPSLPGFVQAGPVVDLGPEGFVFALPVTISIPISEEVDPATVVGAAYFDTSQGIWILVPGSVDATNRTIEVSSTHLSMWTGAAFSVGGSILGNNPNFPPANNADYGSFKIDRPPLNMEYGGQDDHKFHGATTSHGICIRSANYADPSLGAWWQRADGLQFSVDNYWGAPYPDMREPFGIFRVPNGTYQITEFVGQSEINPIDPLYTPHYYQMWRDYGSVTVAGGTEYFSFPNASFDDPAWTVERPPCWGTVTHSVHTGGEGGVQVTLNWNSNADIDLHVIEPDGTEIYYNNDVSPSGGALDQDNQCNDEFVLGKPENIYWETPPDGEYQVNVVYYGDCGGAGAVNFTIRVCISGSCDNPISGTLNAEYDTASVTTFTYP